MSQEGKSAVEDLREQQLINGIQDRALLVDT